MSYKIAVVAAVLIGGTAFAGDDDLGDFDLGGSTGDADLTYSGTFPYRSADKVATDAPITVSIPIGTGTVYCTDSEYVEARVMYDLSGPDGAALKAYGDSLKASASGGASGTARIQSGTKSSTIKTANITVTVNVPKAAKLTINATNGSLKVVGCAGSVTATVSKNGAYVSGPLKAFNLNVAQGDVTVEMDESAKIVGNSAISAAKGNVSLIMPLVEDLKVDVRGASVNVQHAVIGSVGAAAVTGTLGTPGPSLTIKASGDVVVKTPSGSGF